VLRNRPVLTWMLGTVALADPLPNINDEFDARHTFFRCTTTTSKFSLNNRKLDLCSSPSIARRLRGNCNIELDTCPVLRLAAGPKKEGSRGIRVLSFFSEPRVVGVPNSVRNFEQSLGDEFLKLHIPHSDQTGCI
jgi:hypothetical protein